MNEPATPYAVVPPLTKDQGAPTQPPTWPGPVTDQGAAWALTLALLSFIVPVVPAVGALAVAASAQRRTGPAGPERGGVGSGRDGADLVRSAQILAVVNLVLTAAGVVTVIVLHALHTVR